MSDPIEAAAIVLDSHDPDLAGEELYAQLSRFAIVELERALASDNTSPDHFADALARATHKAIITAFHIGRAWQDGYAQHQREHDLEHEGGANN